MVYVKESALERGRRKAKIKVDGDFKLQSSNQSQFPNENLESKDQFLDRLYRMALDSYKPNNNLVNEEVVGMCLSVEKDVPPQPDSQTEKINNISNNPNETVTYMRVYVPGIDEALGLPQDLITPSNRDQSLINQCYLYEAHPANLQSIPKAGDMVSVVHPLSKGYKNKIGEFKGIAADGGTPTAQISAKKKTEQAARTKREKAVPSNIPEKSKCEQEPKGDSCAYSPRGKLLGEIETGKITTPLISNDKEKVMRKDAAEAYERMRTAAKSQGIDLKATSAFRSWKSQDRLYKGWKAKKPGFNPAHKPGNSRHQSGIAIDIQTGGVRQPKNIRNVSRLSKPGVTKIYKWLAKNAAEYGFVRTVSSEPWHWVYFGPTEAKNRTPVYQ
jgi:LAS superfamily LD-carboxypeptidase LdcB